MRKFGFIVITAIIAFALFAVVSCDDDDDVIGDRDETELMVVHASPDAPDIQVFIDDREFVSNLAFPQSTQYLTTESGTHNVEIVQSGVPQQILYQEDVTFAAGNATVFTTNLVANLDVVVTRDFLELPDSAVLKMRVANLSPDAGPVDIVLRTSTNDSLVFSSVNFQDVTAFQPIQSSASDVLSVRVAGTDTVLTGTTPDPQNFVDGRLYTVYLTGLRQGVGIEELTLSVIENR